MKSNDSRTYTLANGDELTEYKLHPTVARLVKELRLGLNGERRHTYRALSRQISGYECQKSGEILERLAIWTLGDKEEDWDYYKESK